MSRFNVSAWAVAHPALVLFFIVMLGTAGLFSYRSLGRGEDPSFTIKLVVVTAMWRGATAAEMQTQVADPIEKKMQELPFIDKVTTYSKSGFTAMPSRSRTIRRPATCRSSSTNCARSSPTSRTICRPD